jgi:hypothetical protein
MIAEILGRLVVISFDLLVLFGSAACVLRDGRLAASSG